MLPSTGRRLVAACLVVLGLSLLAAGAAGLAATAADDTAGEATASPPEPVPGLDLPERVELAGAPTGGSAAVDLDVAAAIHSDGVEIGAAYDRELLAHRFDAAESDGERRAVLATAVERADETARALRERERRARADYRSGDIGEREFVARLRAINDLAAARSTVLSAANDRVDGVDEELERDADALQGGFAARRGEIRDLVSGAMAGEGTDRRVYVAVDADGTVLATIDDDTYHREANRDDLYAHDRSEGIGFDAMRELLEDDLYPGYRSGNDWSLVMEFDADTAYRIRGDHGFGSLHLFVDSSTRDVFREYHALDLDEPPPTRPALTATSGSRSLEVNRTYASGPALVVVTDGDEPVADAPVTVDGTEVARTDEDGTAWVVLPYDTPEVSAPISGIDVSVDVSWTGDGNPGDSTDGDPDAGLGE